MIRSVVRLWALGLMLSVVLVAAGQRWPQSLDPDPVVVAALVLLPPLLMLLWLAGNWSLPKPPLPGTGEGGQSQESEAGHP